MYETILRVGSSIATPLALAGFCASALLFFAIRLVDKGILGPVDQAGGARIISRILTFLFVLAITALVLGVLSYVLIPIIERYQQLTALEKSGVPLTLESLAERVEAGDVQTVVSLIKAGVPIDAQDPMGFPAIARATRNQQQSVLEQLLVLKADPNQTDSEGITPLMYAAQNGDLRAATVLFAHHADAERQDRNGRRMIHYAILGQNLQLRDGHLAIFRLLKEKHVSFIAADKSGATVMSIAAEQEKIPANATIASKIRAEIQTVAGTTGARFNLRDQDRSINRIAAAEAP